MTGPYITPDQQRQHDEAKGDLFDSGIGDGDAVPEYWADVMVDSAPPVVLCPTRTPEPHHLGEFPMTCYRCHVDADS